MSKLDQVVIRDLDLFQDDRGFLFEAIRTDWRNIISTEEEGPIQQVYLVQNPHTAIRAFHRHTRLFDWFCCLDGNIKLVLFDLEDTGLISPLVGPKIINMSGRKPQLIKVPASLYHGWKSFGPATLLCIANALYKGKNKTLPADEERISPYFLKENYDIEVWEQEAK